MATVNEVRLRGKVVGVLSESTKTGKPRVKVIIEVDPPAWMKSAQMERVQVTVFGRSTEAAQALTEGELVAVKARVSGREWQGKIYTDIVADEVKSLGGGKQAQLPVEAAPVDDSDVPF